MGRAVKTEHIPTRVVRQDPKKFIPDVDWGVGMFFVNDKFKDVVERLEPGVHQFVPMEMLWPDGTLAQKMYFFHVCNRLDTVDRELSTVKLSKTGRVWEPKGEMIFNLDQIGDHHIWVDQHTYAPGGFFISDVMRDALEEAGVTGIRKRHFKDTGDF